MKTDVDKMVPWCLSHARKRIEGKRKRAADHAPFDMGIRFNAIAMDTFGPMTTTTRAPFKHTLVITDLFALCAIAVPLLSTEPGEIATEIVEQWLLSFGDLSVFCTDEGGSLVANRATR